MRIRHLVIAPLVLVALFALTGSALAGGWATVTITEPPSDPTVGQETTVEMTVLQHGQTPVSWPRITVVATNTGTGAVVRTVAQALSDTTGRYEATLVFPSDGAWTIAYESPDLIMENSATMDVAAAAPTPAAISTNSGLLLAALGAIVLMFVVAVAGLAIRRRPREHPLTSGS